MHKQLEFLRPDELPSISSSTDPIDTNCTLSQPPISAKIDESLPRRAKSLDIGKKHVSGRDEDSSHNFAAWRGGSISSVQANIKRGKWVKSAPGDVLGQQPPRRSSLIVPPGESNVLLHNGVELKSQLQETVDTQQNELSPERAKKRGTSHLDGTGSKMRKVVNETDKHPIERSTSIKRLLKVTKGSDGPAMPQLSLSGGVENDDKDNEEETYERKGAFWLKRDRGPDEFRFPKSHGHPEPLWRAGDGFSVDEARPDFTFLMTGQHKQRKPRPTSSIGELQIEPRNENEEDLRRSGVSRRKKQRLSHSEVKYRRGAVKDVWPTIENFSEELEVRKRNPDVPPNEKIIPSTIQPQPTPVPRAKDTFEYKPPPMTRKRRASDFENFGRRLGNGDTMSNKSIAENQIDPAHHDMQSEPEGDGTSSDEAVEEEFEVEEDEEDYENELPTSDCGEIDGNGEHDLSDEEDASSSASTEVSSTGSSAISALDDKGHEPRELGQYFDDFSAAGDISREFLEFSQAFS
ncbi:uncharacterized protein GGS22DRAFT_184805 [Annulohypoxylon maeteangense]|uniref:uncharacterized protein n=1 Tax=Annulohypoxylon maeteangense TaxID=1927788 RepID=UPI0020072384|nr:uncharacterized protein GGS22DRAFT_184805 [Annulohypoxylon maeteangense]KAI0889230.1 hypothetical protein GGS22DRAFT_184805 [Annulohypoxylon maeteangense]